MLAALAKLEQLQGQKLGVGDNPLLVSVRSGAKFSMPGMMDTILNLGLNDKAVEALAKRSNNPRFAYDSYRRLIQMFGDVVLDIPKKKFEHIFDGVKAAKKVKFDYELQPDALQKIIAEYKKLVKKETGKDFPQNPLEQLFAARDAVFRSWQNDRAKTYRRINHIDDSIGTAVNVQAMVFGNLGENSGTGVGFTRNPATGEHMFFGEYLMNAQGEDVVSGVRTPNPISELERGMPKVYEQLKDITRRMEKHYRDMQDFEFTIQDGKLYMLQTRNGKRTGLAAVRVAIDMVREGLITQEEAIFRVEPNQLYDFLVPRLVEKGEKIEVLATGLPASPGAAVGQIVFTAEEAVKQHQKGWKSIILVRGETTPEDIAGMEVADGILTSRGGMTSHAAVVTRGMGKCCVAGAGDCVVDEALAHAACDDSGVRGHAAARSKNAVGNFHARDVLRRGFAANQNDGLVGAAVVLLDGFLGGEDDLADSRAGRSRQAGGEHFDLLALFHEARNQEVVKLVGLDAEDSFLLRDEALADHVDGDADRGQAGALAVARLQHVELAILDGELKILHVAIVLFHAPVMSLQLLVDLGHGLLEFADGGACGRRRPRLRPARSSGTRRRTRARRWRDCA